MSRARLTARSDWLSGEFGCSRLYVFPQKLNHCIQRRSGAEDLRYAFFLERWDVGLRDGAAYYDEDVSGFLLFQEREQARDECVVRSGEDAEADAVYVFLDGGVDDGFRGFA